MRSILGEGALRQMTIELWTWKLVCILDQTTRFQLWRPLEVRDWQRVKTQKDIIEIEGWRHGLSSKTFPRTPLTKNVVWMPKTLPSGHGMWSDVIRSGTWLDYNPSQLSHNPHSQWCGVHVCEPHTIISGVVRELCKGVMILSFFIRLAHVNPSIYFGVCAPIMLLL